LVRLIWGPAGLTLPLPGALLTAIEVLPGVYYPLYRLVIIVATLMVALLLYIVVMRTRLGMLIRAGASHREMVGALGINIKLLYTKEAAAAAAAAMSSMLIYLLMAAVLVLRPEGLFPVSSK